MADGSIIIDTKIDSDGYKKSLSQMQKDSTSFAGKLKTTFAGLRDVMQGPVAAAGMVVGAIVKIGKALGDLEKEYLSSARASAILESTLKATGANAWTSKTAIEEMAGQLQDMSGYADDTILSMQNILLGFKNIKGDNFKEASVQILNMATVMGMDLASAAQSVGKALDDPINGVDSLSRQGFRFSESQKEVLKNLVNTGNAAQAQKIILDELNSTYGGAAESANSAANGQETFARAVDDLKESLGAVSSQGITPIRKAFTDLIVDFTKNIDYLRELSEATKAYADGTATMAQKVYIAQHDVDAYANKLAALETLYREGGTDTSNYEKQHAALTRGYNKAYNALIIYTDELGKEERSKKWAAEASAKASEADAKESEKKEEVRKKTDLLIAAYAEYNKQVAIAQANKDKGFFTEEERIDAVKNAAEAYKNKLIEIMVTMGGLGKESSAMLAELQKILSAKISPKIEITPETEAALNKADEEIAQIFAADMLAQQNEAAKAGRAWMKSLAEGIAGGAAVVGSAAKTIIKGIGTVFSTGAKVIKGVFSVLSALAKIDPSEMLESLDEFLDGLTTFFTTTLGSLPIYAKAGADLISSFLSGIEANLPQIVATLVGVVESISGILISSGPTWIQQGVALIVGLVQGIAQSMPTIMLTITTLLTSLITTLMAALPQLIISGADMIVAIIQGFVTAFPDLINAIVSNLPAIIAAIIQAIPMIVTALAEAAPVIISAVISVIPLIIKALVDNLPALLSAVFTMLGTIVKGIIDTLDAAMNSIAKALGDVIWQAIRAVLNGIVWLINQAIGALNTLSFDVPDWVPIIGGGHFGFSFAPLNYFADGTNNAPAGSAIINEEGAELVTLPGGSKVATAAATTDMINQGVKSLLAGLGGYSAPQMSSIGNASTTISLVNKNYNTLQLDGRVLAESVYENIDKVAT